MKRLFAVVPTYMPKCPEKWAGCFPNKKEAKAHRDSVNAGKDRPQFKVTFGPDHRHFTN